MRYALLVSIDESRELSKEEAERQYAEFVGFQDETQARGVLAPASGYARPCLRPRSASAMKGS
jgi:hypothetical protein